MDELLCGTVVERNVKHEGDARAERHFHRRIDKWNDI